MPPTPVYFYLNGLDKRLNWLRRWLLHIGSSPKRRIVLVDMKWGDNHESFERKLARVIAIFQAANTPVSIVAESASGSFVLTVLDRYPDLIKQGVIICGKNVGADTVADIVYAANPALRTSLRLADELVSSLTATARQKLQVIYSPLDGLIYEKDTVIKGVPMRRIYVPTHWLSIGWCMLRWRHFVGG